MSRRPAAMSVRQALQLVSTSIPLLLTTAAPGASHGLGSTRQGSAEQTTLVIRDVTVLSMSGADPIEQATVTVRADRITGIFREDTNSTLPAGARSIDGEGGFLVPGLIDAHVHLRDADTVALERYLVAGITTVRDMNGRPPLLRWRDRIAAGELAGPRLLVSAPTAGNFSSPQAGYPTPETVEAGREWVRRFAEEGYDWIKVYSFLPAAGFSGIMEEAERIGIPVGGHVPVSVSILEALASGLRSVEHLTEYVGFAQTSASRRLDEADHRSVFHAGTVDQSRLDSLIEITVESGAWNVPTLVWFDRNLPTTRVARPWSDPTLRREGRENRRAIVRRLHEAGAHLAVGTDSDDGFDLGVDAIHDELAALVEAGLTPTEALGAATVGGAGLLGLDDTGTIEVGKRADLLVLYCDPRDDLGCLREPAHVVAGGRTLP